MSVNYLPIEALINHGVQPYELKDDLSKLLDTDAEKACFHYIFVLGMTYAEITKELRIKPFHTVELAREVISKLRERVR